jgi:dipeptidyl aminopeptidase/acylaminoacyl peptidase
MSTDYRATWLVTASLLFSLVGVSFAAPPRVEAFGQRPALIDVDLNPAGTRLAFIEDDGKTARVIIHDLVAHKDLRRFNTANGTRLRAVYWANDDTLLIDERVTHSVELDGRNAHEWQRWAAVDAAGGAADRLLLMNGGAREWVTGAHLIRRQTAKPGKVFMSTLDFSETNYRSGTGTRLSGGRKDSGWISSLYEVDIATGDGRTIASGTSFTDSWLADESATHIVRSEWNPTREVYEITAKVGGGWKNLYQARECGRLSLIALAPDNLAAIAIGTVCGETRAKLWSLPLDGSPMKALAEDDALDVESVLLDPLDGKPLAIDFGGAGQSRRWLDPQAERRSAGLHRTFAATHLHLVSHSSDGKRVVALAENASHPPIYYLVDYNAKTADIINEQYPELNGVKLGAVQEFEYLARDKYPLMAYLTLPPDSSGKNLPAVILPHGGPEAHDDSGFDWLAQFLASRGYAVLQPQFRGSDGFGSAHADAGRHQWGLRMQDDVTDGVRALTEKGIADPKRICIVGGSYGGYVALAGAAFTPELYACAASIAGVSDLPAMIGYTVKMEGEESNLLAYWRDHIGSPLDPQVIAKSPARSAATIRAPILLLHGTEDTVVPLAQSKMMARALDAANRQYSLVELPGDDHYLSTSATRVLMLGELEKFLAPFLAAAPAAQTSN